MIAILKTLGVVLLKTFGYKYLLKSIYRFFIRKQLLKVSKKIDPNDDSYLDEEIIDKIDEVFENL